MRHGDVAAAESLSAQAFSALALRRAADEAPRRSDPRRAEAWQRRTRHLLATDPQGCWVVERDDVILGFATSLVRERTWILASYAVRPGLQGQGLGTQLLTAAAQHGRGCLRGMLNSSTDPAALRRYRAAGFRLYPQLVLSGPIERRLLPPVRHVRDGSDSDFDLMDSLDRRIRGSAHGPDHQLLIEQLRLLVTDRPAASGYAYVDRAGAPVLLAATHRKAAAALMWTALAESDPETSLEVRCVSAANDWALDVALAARLSIGQRGFLGLRGMREPAPYLPHPSLL